MMNAAIAVSGLTKTFSQGRKKPQITAVDGISFVIQPGERVAFVGPNGAGKSTTIKMLTGILQPTAGSIAVLGHSPATARRQLAYRIGAIFGQRSQLWYHLPVDESLELLSKVYGIPTQVFEERLGRMLTSFGIGDLVKRPVRQLSLGERMRFEILACMLHGPEILFLDEPTIGLDVSAKAVIRDFIKDLAATERTTVLLTSHDPGDIENVCDRMIMINHGRVVLDQELKSLCSAGTGSLEMVIRRLYESSQPAT